jgi:hypothetical protein
MRSSRARLDQRLPLIVTRRPRTACPRELREVLDELAAVVSVGALTSEVFGDLMTRTLDAARVIEDDEEREAHIKPLWDGGATCALGCCSRIRNAPTHHPPAVERMIRCARLNAAPARRPRD